MTLATTPAADPATTAQHYARRLQFETDCADVHATLEDDPSAIVLVDARSREAFEDGHIEGAVSLPHADIDPAALAEFPRDALFVTYCWGPHCNAGTKAAARIATHGRRVKEMLGGVWGWQQEGHELVSGSG